MIDLKTEIGVYKFYFSLKLLGLALRVSPRLRREVYNVDTGFSLEARYQFLTRDGKVRVFARFSKGVMSSGFGTITDPDVTIQYRDKATLARIHDKGAEESLDYLLANDMSYTGNISCLMKFSYLGSLLGGGRNGGPVYAGPDSRLAHPIEDLDKSRKRPKRENETLGRKVDAVAELPDPYLGAYTLDDFPRLKKLRNRRFSLRPAICVERARLLTEHHRKNGFEKDPKGNPIRPGPRQGAALKHILENKKAIIHEDHLLAGSTTSKEVGVPVYPEFIGTLIWPELKTIGSRELNPNDLCPADAEILNHEVFPYWMDRNVREHCRATFGNPQSQRLEERFVLYFMMKNNAISHTVPGFAAVIEKGLEGLLEEAREGERSGESDDARDFYRSAALALSGALDYGRRLSEEASRQAGELGKKGPERAARAAELQEIARVCARAPARPAETLYEGVMSIWVTFVCLHGENANSALSIGRLDQLLQPLFLADMARASSAAEREETIRRSIELVGSLFLRLNDHDPLIPYAGNKLFGGSSSDDTVTVGGVGRAGDNAVCDMTYIALKAAEMLGFQDPNMNARYYPGVNSAEYLRRLCEVNMNMGASPIVHNDKAMIESLANQGILIEDARDWAATGCVEPTIQGRHYGHTNCMLLNMVAPLEMALNNGVHPVMGEKIGPETGDPGADFATFEDFLAAYKTQLEFLVLKSIEINNYLGRSHRHIHPTPLLSAMTEGAMESGRDVIDGGARYNTSGVALVSITDVVDSLAVIRELVYEQGETDFETLLAALETDFAGHERLLAKIGKVPKFGSGDERTLATARDLMDFCYDLYQSKDNYRGGKYLPGYWSISYHVGFGMLSGALPSGRKRGKAFTPGLTPAPGASDQLLDNIKTIAGLDHMKMPNNLAFNVKVSPPGDDPREEALDRLTAYPKTYFDMGGMQWQFNVVSSKTMREAMERPEEYRWLLVRISGYNAYFTKLNRNMQMELIERAEFGT